MRVMQFLKEAHPKIHGALALVGFVLFSVTLPIGFVLGALWSGICVGFRAGIDA